MKEVLMAYKEVSMLQGNSENSQKIVTVSVDKKPRVQALDELDRYYPKECQIRVVSDNHSAHVSKETMAYLATKPNRFIYVHTPTHGSWLNLVETLTVLFARLDLDEKS